MDRRHLLQGIASCTVSLLATGLPARAMQQPHLFGANERERADLGKFPKWQGTLEKYFKEEQLMHRPCEGGRFAGCDLQNWQRFLDGVRGQHPQSQIGAVHVEMNRRNYILDPINWNLPDYWASPGEFLRKQGDCEDYAIAKYMSLRALGHDPAKMRVVVLHDNNLNIGHAVLSLHNDNDILILDNQLTTVVQHGRIRHYRPIYSINEFKWWIHS